MAAPVLYDYWRSSASYRVRIALRLLNIGFETVPVNLVAGEQKAAAHMARNPQGLVPVLDMDGQRLTQSLAVIEYLAETHPEAGLLPVDPLGRARVRALSHAIAMDIHPICNTGTINHVMALTGGGEAEKKAWMQKFIGEGLTAFEQMLDHPATGAFCHGDAPSMADICLIPQIYNAHRWGAKIEGLTRIGAVVANCKKLAAFKASEGPEGE